MKTFKVSFIGRQTGAIGIFYKINDTYQCKDIHECMSLLYTDYECIKGLSVKDKKGNSIEIPKEINFVKIRSYTERERSPKTGNYKYTHSDAPIDYKY